jgi:hypothetical protein
VVSLLRVGFERNTCAVDVRPGSLYR